MFDLLIDLDNTVYSENSKIFSQVDAKMKTFISRELNLSLKDSYALQKKYFREYGTTLSGLMINEGIKPDPFLEYVHNIDLSSIKKNINLKKELECIDGKKIIFTNGTRKHARNVLKRVGIESCINNIFDIIDANYIPKPNVSTYEKVVERFNLNTSKCVMIDDIPVNLKTAKDLGFHTMLIKNNLEIDELYTYVDYIAVNLEKSLVKLKKELL